MPRLPWKRNEQKMRRPENAADRERLLRKLATDFGNRKMTEAEYERHREKVKNCMTARELRDVQQMVAGGAAIVSAIAAVVGIFIEAGGGATDTNVDSNFGADARADDTGDAALGDEENEEYDPDVREENDGWNEEGEDDDLDGEDDDDIDDCDDDDF